MMINDIRPSPGLRILVIPLECIGEHITDRHRRAWTAGFPHNLRAAIVEVDDLGGGLFLIAQLLRERLIEQPDSSDGGIVAVLATNDLQDFQGMLDVTILGPRSVGGFLSGVVEAVLAPWGAVEVHDDCQAGSVCPLDGFVEVLGGTGDVGIICQFFEGPI